MRNFKLLLLLLSLLIVSCKKDAELPPEPEPIVAVKAVSLNDIHQNLKVEANCLTPSLGYGSNNVVFLFANKIDPSKQILLNQTYYNLKFAQTNVKYSVKDSADNKEIAIDTFKKSLTNDTLWLSVNDKLLPGRSYTIQFNYLVYRQLVVDWEPMLDDKGVQMKDSIVLKFSTLKLPTSFETFDLAKHNLLKGMVLYNSAFPIIQLNYPDSTQAYFSQDHLSIDTIKACVSSFKITKAGQDVLMKTQKIDNTTIKAIPTALLEPNTAYQSLAVANYYKKVKGQWLPLLDGSGQVISETKTLDFTTTSGVGDNLPDYYIAYSYPIKSMFNFYKNEYNRGYVEFAYNLDQIPSINVNDIQVNFYTHPYSSILATMPVQLDADSKTIWFDIPTNLENEKACRVDVVSNGKVIYTIPFRTSIYSTFREKIPVNPSNKPWLSTQSFKRAKEIYYSDLCFSIYFSPSPNEGLSLHELYDSNTSSTGKMNCGLVRVVPLMEQWEAYNSSIFKYINDHASDLKRYIKRDLSVVAFPPYQNTIAMCQILYNRVLTNAEIASGEFDSYGVNSFYFGNWMPEYWASDFLDIQEGLKKEYSSSEDIRDEKLKSIYNFNGNYLQTPLGDYSLQLDYVLPGKNIITSSIKIPIVNPWW